MWIGVDDTDGPRGGCTTFVLTEIVRVARAMGYDLIGLPRLVRLNPNVPYKTRGNGALAARFGHGRGRPREIGRIQGRPVFAHPRGGELGPSEQLELERAAWKIILERSGPPAESDPGMVASRSPIDPRLYRSGVAEMVPIADARRAIRRAGGAFRHRGSARGLVGAAAAIAWPGRRRTYELLAYRHPDRIGGPRRISASSVRRAQRADPSLFLCFDPRTRRLLVAPHTGCPILYGLRSTRLDGLPEARRRVRSEPVDRWLVFQSNQGTGDHLRNRRSRDWPRFAAGFVDGTVRSSPESLPGGHVRFRVGTGSAAPTVCLVFEPSKSLAGVARTLRVGDGVRVYGGRGKDVTVRVERLGIRRLSRELGSRRPPRCPECDRTAASRGRNRGYRCGHCRRRFPPESGALRAQSRPYGRGIYDPTPSARRHLHPRTPEPA
jgi:tRNA(Ile2)-agmatinylcytidine synthase